jgi:hypothetical protein
VCVFLNMCAHTLVIEHFLYIYEWNCVAWMVFKMHIHISHSTGQSFTFWIYLRTFRIYSRFEFRKSHCSLFFLYTHTHTHTQSMQMRRITGQYQLKFENYSKWIKNVPFSLRKFWNLGVWIVKLIKIRREKKLSF